MKTPLREIHEIELSSRCNLACTYCPHPVLEREKEDMYWAVFDASMRLLKRLCSEGTQGELSLTGIGEAVLHPHFVEMAAEARSVLGMDRPFVLTTNGLALTEEIIGALVHLKPKIYVSLHRPELAGPAIERVKRAGLELGVNASFATSSLDWAGQVKWHVSAPRSECQYLAQGWGVVRADGRITTCCMDAHTKHAFGTVWSPKNELVLAPHALCRSCNLDVPKESTHAHA